MDNSKSDGSAVIPFEDLNRPKAMNGTVSLPKVEKFTQEDLVKAENALRRRAKVLAKQIDTTYWDLGQCLYEVFDGVPGGYRELMRGDGTRTTRSGLFEKWGFKSFAEYSENELGIMKRSAEYLRYAYYWFEIALHIPKEIKEKIISLGRSKVYILAGVVKEEDVMTWIEKAENMTNDELKKVIKAVKASKRSATQFDEEERELATSYTPTKEDEDFVSPKAVPAPEQMHQLTTSLYEPQWATWQAAFDRAKSISNSEKIGHNLELICQDFLMNNDFKEPGEKDLKSLIIKLERIIQKKLICIDSTTGKPIHGADLLWLLVQERVNEEKKEADRSKTEISNVTSLDVHRKIQEENEDDYDDVEGNS